jgi:3-oxoacyl-[acyl-carrier-protein] synthase II
MTVPEPTDTAVVITGIGAVTPLGDADALYARWRDGTSAITDGEAPCAEFDATGYLSTKQARRMDRFTQLAVVAAEQAAADAWGTEPPHPPARVGCILGTGIGGMASFEAGHTDLVNRQPVSPLAVPLMMGNAGAAAIAIRQHLHGPVFGVVSACAAGAHAIGAAMRAIQTGEADAMITGGAEATLTPLARAAFSSLGATSPSGISRPFDARRDGFVMGEGAGILILEAEHAAERRGAQPLGVLRGYGASCDAYHLTAPDQNGNGAAAAISAALTDAGIGPADVDYVNAHGTSTPLNDRAETDALKAALGPRARQVPVSSLKSAIGHLLGAAGAVEAIATILALRERIIPPTLNYSEPEPGLDLDYVPDRARALDLTDSRQPVAISNSFGFGGHNAVLCLQAA